MTDAPDLRSLHVHLVEQVLYFASSAERVVVSFSRSAAEYHVPAAHPDLLRLVGMLADAWRSGTEVEVTVLGTEIIDIAPHAER